MTTPALLRLREALPDTHVSLLCPAKLSDLWVHHPAIDAVVAFAPGEPLRSIARRLRVLACDTALILPNSPRSALECWLARIPQRVGFTRPWRDLLLTHRISARSGTVRMHKPSRTEIRSRLIAPRNPPVAAPPLAAHQCHEYLHLAAALGAHSQILPPQLRVTEDEVQTARAKFGLTSNQPWLALNPGAEYGPAKRWPADRFAAVAKNLEGAGAGRWILLGGRNDQPITAVIASQLRSALDLAGRTSLRELMALLSGCRILLTNDTGPMHVGAALGLPVIVPFGSTSPELTGPGVPGDPRHRLLRAGAPCAPCFLRDCPIDFRCMLGLEVEHVTAAALEALRPRG